ncbi:unnamed protein product, partial [Lymnaea stagnalis]
MLGARNATFHGQPVKMIGPLVVTPYNLDFVLKPHNVTKTTVPATTPPTTSTTTRRTTTTTLPDLIYIYAILPTYNLTLTPDLRDPNSKAFMDLTFAFCKDLERLYNRSIYGRRFHSCKVHSFRGDPASVVVSVGYVGEEWPGMDDSVTWVIRKNAPSYYFGLK